MKVLALTHAHLNAEGLSPVSCERADSIIGTWAEKLNWDVDVVHTNGTKWRGIWPDGKGLRVNILHENAPADLLMGMDALFSKAVKDFLQKGKVVMAASLVQKRIAKRGRKILSAKGFARPHELILAKQWGMLLSQAEGIRNQRYDFLFVCVGHGDEYLLQTALTLSNKLHAPMIVDFRDLWSEHHVASRFTAEQRKHIHRLEQQLLTNAALISVPQKHMTKLLQKWAKAPVYLLTHSAYIDSAWPDGKVVSDAFTMLYAGKLYPEGPGVKMLLELIQKLSRAQMYKPVRCRFFVDDTQALQHLAASYGVVNNIDINGWISPSELWSKMRSAHLLVIPDAGVSPDFPLLPTKTFQYASTGQKILGLSPHNNAELQEFLQDNGAGKFCTTVDDAVRWIIELSFNKEQYEVIPPIRQVAMRSDVAIAYGQEIEKVLIANNVG